MSEGMRRKRAVKVDIQLDDRAREVPITAGTFDEVVQIGKTIDMLGAGSFTRLENEQNL